MIWLSVNRDFFMVEIFLRKSLLLTTLVFQGITSAAPDPVKVKLMVRQFGVSGENWRIGQAHGFGALHHSFYESKGLLQAVSRQLNGYREYPPEAVMVLGIISSAQQTGFLWTRSSRSCLPTCLTGSTIS